jgi:FkbM family methyltransferase
MVSAMFLKQIISRSMRTVAPKSWQYLKCRQYLRGDGEREIHVLNRLVDPNRAALDIGVHLGMYTRHLAKCADSVFGFEANPNSAEFASRSLRGLATIYWTAVSSEAGMGSLLIPVEGAGGAEAALGTLSQTNVFGGARFREVEVPVKRLDDFELPLVGFVKIDVEGHEEEVLQGGEAMLMRDRPVYLIELEERHNSGLISRVVERFRREDYGALFYDGSSFRGIAEFDQETDQASSSRI